MTEAVRTEGFNAPAGAPALPPLNPMPGFVAQQPDTPVSKEAAPAPAAQPTPNGLEAAVAALMATLTAQNATQQPEPAADTESLNAFDVNTIEDPVMRSMATVMQTVGKDLDMDRVFAKALETGNEDFLDIAYLREKGGANAEQLITIAQGIIKGVNAEALSVQQSVYAKAGSEQQWNACTGVFNKTAPETLRAVVATMLNSGVKSQITAAADLVVEFSKGSGFVPNAKPTLESGFASVPAAQALGKDEFQTELQKLNPNDKSYIAKRGELFARRQMGKQLGM